MMGRTLGQCQIQEQFGSGGTGIVYKAHDTKLDGTVALKFLPPNISSDESAKARFIQDARGAARPSSASEKFTLSSEILTQHLTLTKILLIYG